MAMVIGLYVVIGSAYTAVLTGLFLGVREIGDAGNVRLVARLLLLAPVWPIAFVWLAMVGVRIVWRAADWRVQG